MRLFTARTTSISYPTDVALQRKFIKRGVPDGELVPVQLALSGTLDGTNKPIFGVQYSPNNGVTWNAALMTVEDAGASPTFEIPNNRLVRPTFDINSGTQEANGDLIG